MPEVSRQNTSRIAQSFYVDKNSGIFITDIGLFFKSAPDTTGQPVYVTIRALEGGVPHGYVYIAKAEQSYSNISASIPNPNATNEIKFTFAHPVYLEPFKYYAFTVETGSSEYELYYAEIYDHVLNSTEKLVDKNPVSGSIFYSQNGVTWSENQNQDLKFKIYKANWAAYWSGTRANVSLQNKAISQEILPNNPITTDGATTDIIISHKHHGFQEGDKVNISGVTSNSGYIGGIHINNINGLRTIKSGSGNVASRDWQGYILETGSGTANTTLTNEIGGGANVKADRNFLYSTFVPSVSVLKTHNTASFYGVKTMAAGKNPYNSEAGAYVRDTAYSQVMPNKTMFMFNNPGLIASTEMEGDNPGTSIPNNKSFDLRITLSSEDPANVMPFVDLERASIATMYAAVDNPSLTVNSSSGQNMVINPIAETLPEGGTTLAKHITKIFPLESSAIGLRVAVAGNVLSGGSFDLYYRVAELDTNISTQAWVLIAPSNNPTTSEKRGVFKDYEYLIGGQSGFTTPFQQFQFKITMKANNAIKAPILREFRAIALST